MGKSDGSSSASLIGSRRLPTDQRPARATAWIETAGRMVRTGSGDFASKDKTTADTAASPAAAPASFHYCL